MPGINHARVLIIATDGVEQAELTAPRDALRKAGAGPNRVSGGGLNLSLPTSYDYATQTAQWATNTLSLAPTGRELTAELAWHTPLLGGSGSANLFWRKDPGHYANLPDDKGVGISWQGGF